MSCNPSPVKTGQAVLMLVTPGNRTSPAEGEAAVVGWAWAARQCFRWHSDVSQECGGGGREKRRSCAGKARAPRSSGARGQLSLFQSEPWGCLRRSVAQTQPLLWPSAELGCFQCVHRLPCDLGPPSAPICRAVPRALPLLRLGVPGGQACLFVQHLAQWNLDFSLALSYKPSLQAKGARKDPALLLCPPPPSRLPLEQPQGEAELNGSFFPIGPPGAGPSRRRLVSVCTSGPVLRGAEVGSLGHARSEVAAANARPWARERAGF